jgi:peptide deformylase
MATLDLRYYPDTVLREKCEEVETFDEKLAELLDNMIETMYAENGVGLAAPQVGITQRVTVIDVSPDQDTPIELINPVIADGEGSVTSEEGCLSIPEFRESVKRKDRVVVEAFDRLGGSFTIEAEGLLSICLQHEIDHLNGVLFIDHLSRLKRELFKRWYKKQLAELEA